MDKAHVNRKTDFIHYWANLLSKPH